MAAVASTMKHHVLWGQALHINRHDDGDEEKLVNECGGQFRTVVTLMQPRWARGSVPASSAVGACACPAGGGRQGQSQTDSEAGMRTRGGGRRGVPIGRFRCLYPEAVCLLHSYSIFLF